MSHTELTEPGKCTDYPLIIIATELTLQKYCKFTSSSCFFLLTKKSHGDEHRLEHHEHHG